MIPQAKKLFQDGRAPTFAAFEMIYTELVDKLGCTATVKTIYVAFSVSGTIVVAVHPRKDHFEIALPLIEDAPQGMIYDGRHLKWRDLTMATRIDSTHAVASVIPVLRSAYWKAIG